jgi:hypothetical protein
MPQTLRLGLFNFRNDDVLLLAGDSAAVVALGMHLSKEFDSGKSCVAIHNVAVVSTRHPASIFAVRGDFPSPEQNAYIWRCSTAHIEELLTAGSGASELHFELTRTPPYFYINFSGHYNETWWSTYG